MQVVPVYFKDHFGKIDYDDIWNLDYTSDIKARFDAYFSKSSPQLSSWANGDNRYGYFLTII